MKVSRAANDELIERLAGGVRILNGTTRSPVVCGHRVGRCRYGSVQCRGSSNYCSSGGAGRIRRNRSRGARVVEPALPMAGVIATAVLLLVGGVRRWAANRQQTLGLSG